MINEEAQDAGDPFSDVVGQDRAIEQLRAAATSPVHAYLFVGPRGSGKRRAAAALAGELVGDPNERDRSRRLCRTEDHPDLVIIEPEGNTFRTEEAQEVIIAASRAPAEPGQKVIVLDRFHDATAETAAKLLKPIEEPPRTTVIVLLSEEVPPEHVTIASRSTRIDFPAVTPAAIAAALVERGVAGEVAKAAAEGSGGDVGRALLLVSDEAYAHRRNLWWTAPSRLDGSGHAVSEVIAEIRAAVDEAQAPLEERQAQDIVAMDEQEELTGTRGSGRRVMEIRHRREARLHRTDEWRMGLATLALRYRGAAIEGRVDLAVFETLTDATDALTRNPNEELWLTELLLSVPQLLESP